MTEVAAYLIRNGHRNMCAAGLPEAVICERLARIRAAALWYYKARA